MNDTSSRSATAGGVGDGVAGGAVHLRGAAQRVGVLHTVVAVAMAGDDRRAGEQAAQVGGAASPGRPAAASPRDPRRTPGRCRAAPRPTSPPAMSAIGSRSSRSCEGQHEHAEHPVGAVDQRQALLGPQRARGCDAGGASAPAPSTSGAVGEPRLALADEHERGGGERGEVAARAERAVLVHDRRDAGVEQRRRSPRRPRAGRRRSPSPGCGPAAASSPAPPRVSTLGPEPGGVRADQRELQLGRALGRDDGVGRARRSRSRRRTPGSGCVDQPVDHRRAARQRVDGRRRRATTVGAAAGDGDDVDRRPCHRGPSTTDGDGLSRRFGRTAADAPAGCSAAARWRPARASSWPRADGWSRSRRRAWARSSRAPRPASRTSLRNGRPAR